MVQTCQRCRRANPRDAIYCYHDGLLLVSQVGGDIPADGSAMNIGARPFTVPFVFPSGHASRNFLDFATYCQREPAVVRELLREGHIKMFLAGQGRADLAGAAQAAALAPDWERGFDDFLGRLPVPLTPARPRVEPAILDLGTMHIGEDRRCELTLHNDGMRLVYGMATCTVPWLSLGDGAPAQNKIVQFSSRASLPVRVLGKHLRAFEKPQETDIVFDVNGATLSVPVRLTVPVKPFPEGVLHGSFSPRELAKKAKEMPKEAAALLESGAVARWYESNGWQYPVLGPSASGIAAVQQLFEALGLVKPPPVELSEDALKLHGPPGEKIEYSLAVITQENRAAIAHGSSDEPWLQVGRTIFRGRSAFLPITVAAVPGQPGETRKAVVSVVANGRQRFAVPVTLTVDKPVAAAPSRPAGAALGIPVGPAGAPHAAAPVPQQLPVPIPQAAARTPALPLPAGMEPARRSLWLTLLPAVLLLAVAGGGAVRDFLAPQHKSDPVAVPVDNTPRIEINFHDSKHNDDLEKVYLSESPPTMRFGIVMLRKGQEVAPGQNSRRLTFDPWGRTNNACLRFDKHDERLFAGGPTGHWADDTVKTWTDDAGKTHEGVKCTWLWDDKKIEAAQLVELVRGEQSGLLDTCRVQYRLHNRDSKAHTVGIRFLLDTFIGGNDNAPFTIPGDGDLCDTLKDLPRQARDHKLPDFLQALEKPDLANPGTIAHLRLKVENLEPPARVTLGAWPNDALRVIKRKAYGLATLWDVPLLSMKSLGLNDSAITIYWEEKPLPPGGTRDVGFEYGLWNLARAGSRLAATVDGAFRPDGQLTIVAYVNRSAADAREETASLAVPAGFKLVDGTETQPVPRLPAGARSGNVAVTWKVQAGPIGSYQLTVRSSSGVSQTLRVEIRKSIY